MSRTLEDLARMNTPDDDLRVEVHSDEDAFSSLSEYAASLLDAVEDGSERRQAVRVDPPRQGFQGGASPPARTMFEDAGEGIAALNEVCAVVPVGTKMMIAVRSHDGSYVYLNVADARLRFAPYQLFCAAPKGSKAKDKWVSLFDVWLKSPDRRAYETVTCDPSIMAPPSVLNTWTGLALQPKAGDCSLMLSHITESTCGGDRQVADTVLDWMAHMLQRPAEKPGFAIVAAGPRGTGKTTVAEWLIRMVGRLHSVKISQARQVTGQFNVQLDAKLFGLLEEVTFGGDKAGEGPLKDLITATTVMIEAKYGSPQAMPSFIRFFMASNDPHAIRAGAAERRYLVTQARDVNEGKSPTQKKAYFDALEAQANSGGLEALMDVLMRRNISRFDRFRPPMTRQLVEQIERSLSDEDKWVAGVLDDGVFTDREGVALHDGAWSMDRDFLVSSAAVQQSHAAHVRLFGGSSGGSRAARRALLSHGEVVKERATAGDRERLFLLGPRREWQQRFTARFGIEFDPEGAEVVSLSAERGRRGG